MRVALVIVPAWSTMTAPLGIASIAAQLLRVGHETRVFDFNIELWNKHRTEANDPWDYSKYRMWQEEESFHSLVLPWLEESLLALTRDVAAWKPDLLGLSLFDTSFPCGRVMAKYFRRLCPDAKIVLGGPGISASRFLHFDARFYDVAVFGEGEATVAELLERLERGETLQGCRGIGYVDDSGKPRIEPVRPNISLNDLPFPYFKDFNFELYRELKLPIMMSRGCTAKCTFCSETRFWNKYRYREAQHIFFELQNNLEKHGINSFAVADSLVNGNFRVLSDLADLIIQSERPIFWNGYARLDDRMTGELLQRLAKSGCTYLSFGLETGSQKVMDLMEKRTTVSVARRVIRDTSIAGIQVHLNIIVGFPGETERDFQETLDFLEENIRYISVVNTGEALSIAPDTPLFQDPRRFGIRTFESGQVFYDREGNWESQDGENTHFVRRSRLTRLREFLNDYEHILWYPGGARKREKAVSMDFHP